MLILSFSFLIAILAVCSLCESFIVSDSQRYRELIATRNTAFVEEHNQRPEKPFIMKAYSQWLEYTQQELSQILLSHGPRNTDRNLRDGVHQVLGPSPRPSGSGLTSFLSFNRERRVNWTDRGMVSPVKDQGFCGSCYAFAAVADIESSYLFRGKKLDLSEQHIIDCSQVFGNDGCSGGWMGFAFAFAMLKGVTSELRYPLTNETTISGVAGTCLYNRGQFKIKSYAYTSMKVYDCESLTSMVEKRPVTVALAIDLYFFFYWDGVLENCGTEINHGAQVTGFVEGNGGNYWILKNSWGTWWGMQGYVHISREKNYGNLCEICYAPSYSII